MARTAEVERETGETRVRVRLNLDGDGRAEVSTGVGFLDHLLHLLAHHSGIDLLVEAKGDTWVDDHHTVEDTGLVLGRALDEALGDRAGLTRFADASAPLIEALSTAVVDLGARSHLTCNLGPALAVEVQAHLDAGLAGLPLDFRGSRHLLRAP